MTKDSYYIGVDVGTKSARAGIVDQTGTMIASATLDIPLWHPRHEWAEQSSDAIWNACCSLVRDAVAQSKIQPETVRGIGFCATSSLVTTDSNDQPVTISSTGDDSHNVIVWMDHRAADEAEHINATRHKALNYCGGTISPEMAPPKLLWIKNHLPQTWNRAAHFFELPDFLTHRATGNDTRSLCTLVCKWLYQGHEQSGVPETVGRWDDSFLRTIGLDELVDEDYSRIGRTARPIGEPIANGLTEKAAAEFGLPPGTPVGTAMVDGHAGAIALIGMPLNELAPDSDDFERRLAMIAGTSSALFTLSRDPRHIPGIWGPYYSALLPDMWLTEGGESATGALIDHLLLSHTKGAELLQEATHAGKDVYELLNERLEWLAVNVEHPALLTRNLHVLPYFHGNRTPRADPTLRGMISGLSISGTIDDLALLYLAALQSIAYGTRHIISEMNSHGFAIDTIIASGGLTKNPLFLREHADITQCPIVLPKEEEAMLLGAAILAATASGNFPALPDAMTAMTSEGKTLHPASGNIAHYHASKYRVFQRMYNDQTDYRDLMEPRTS